MSPSPPEPSTSPRFRPPIALIAGGVIIITVGFGLPRLLTGGGNDPPVAEAASPQVAKAAELSGPAETRANDTNLFGALARFGVGLVLVCGVCVAITRSLAKKQSAAAGTMQVVASLMIDARCIVHLVRAGERRLLIGTDVSGVKAVAELPGREPVPAPAPTTVEVKPSAVSGKSTVLGPFAVPAPEQPSPAPSPTRDEVLAVLERVLKSAAVKSLPRS
jgi:flagellar biogenesis protein FliO